MEGCRNKTPTILDLGDIRSFTQIFLQFFLARAILIGTGHSSQFRRPKLLYHLSSHRVMTAKKRRSDYTQFARKRFRVPAGPNNNTSSRSPHTTCNVCPFYARCMPNWKQILTSFMCLHWCERCANNVNGAASQKSFRWKCGAGAVSVNV